MLSLRSFIAPQVLGASLLLSSALASHAATLKVSPAGAQPGDIVTVTVYPAAGEQITGIGMSAWDTSEVKFSMKPDGTARAFVGFPFDRHGGNATLKARVRVQRNGAESEQVLASTLNARERNFPTQRFNMNNSNSSTMSKKDALRQEKLLVQSKMKNSSPTPLWSGNWIIPSTGSQSSSYGRKRWINGKWWGQHNGADIKAPTGREVRATNSGRVVLSQYLPLLRGNCIVVDHGCNIFSIYMHLSKRDVSEGQSVQKGQRVGAVGATGFVTGAHLHWEMRVGWEPVDPFLIVKRGVQF